MWCYATCYTTAQLSASSIPVERIYLRGARARVLGILDCGPLVAGAMNGIRAGGNGSASATSAENRGGGNGGGGGIDTFVGVCPGGGGKKAKLVDKFVQVGRG